MMSQLEKDTELQSKIMDLIEQHFKDSGKMLYHFHLYLKKDTIIGFERRWHWPKEKMKYTKEVKK